MAKLSYFKKELKECPICSAKFQEEIMFTGGMRQVSIKLTNELRTTYKDYNEQPVVPFMYEVMTCPKCLYSALNMDFDGVYVKPTATALTEKKKAAIIEKKREVLKDINVRKELIQNLYEVNFAIEKNLSTGLAAYILAEKCYDYFDEKHLPIVKKAMCSIRAAWIASDLKLEELTNEYYKKTYGYYSDFTSKTDNTAGIKIGPDWGNNFGFDGARFLAALLAMKFLNEVTDLNEKFKVFQSVRTTLSKIRGYGKASKQKVGPLLRLAEEMFDTISPQFDKLKEIIEKQGDSLDESTVDSKQFDVKLPEEKVEEKKSAVPAAAASATASKDLDKYHKAAIAIVKYAMTRSIKKDSVNDLKKILQKHF